jgi:hypothetical protein
MGHHDDSGRPGFTMELKWISGRIVVLCAVISLYVMEGRNGVE